MAERLGFQDLHGGQYPPLPTEIEEPTTGSSSYTHRGRHILGSRLIQGRIKEAEDEQFVFDTDATNQLVPHGQHNKYNEIPIDPALLREDDERALSEGKAAASPGGWFPVAPVTTQDQEMTQRTESPVAGDTYLASAWDLAPVPAVTLASSPSSFPSPSSLGGDPSAQTDPHSRQERLDRMIKRMGGFTHRGKTPQGLPKTKACGFTFTTKGVPSNADNSGTRGRLRCVVCTLRFSSMVSLYEHFEGCVQNHGNPSGACFDGDVSCDLQTELAELAKRAVVQGRYVENQKSKNWHR